MKNKKMFYILGIIVVIILLVVIVVCTKKNGSSNTPNNTETTFEPMIVVKSTADLKTIFDTTGLVLIYKSGDTVSENVKSILTDMANQYQKPVYLANDYLFVTEKGELNNVTSILDKIRAAVGEYPNSGIVTPDFYEIKDGKIYTRIPNLPAGYTTTDNLTDSQINEIKGYYKLSFERMGE